MKKITGINVIDGQLVWTDGRNEPRRINIDTFAGRNMPLQATSSAVDHSSGTTEIYGNEFFGEHITVIKLHPKEPLTYVSTIDASNDTPPFEKVYPRFSYRWRYEDGQYSPYAPFTEAVFTPDTYSPQDHF